MDTWEESSRNSPLLEQRNETTECSRKAKKKLILSFVFEQNDEFTLDRSFDGVSILQ